METAQPINGGQAGPEGKAYGGEDVDEAEDDDEGGVEGDGVSISEVGDDDVAAPEDGEHSGGGGAGLQRR